MITTPSMGLKRWDQANDTFSYVELSDNFGSLDVHDHSAGKGVQIPTAGIVNSAIDTTKLADNSVTNAKILAASVLDTRLASPNNNVYKTAFIGAVNLGSVSATTISMGLFFRWNPADYSVTNKTPVWRVNAGLLVNATAPAANFIVGVYPVTGGTGGVGVLNYTIGAVVAGSTATFTTPAAGSANTAVSADFAAPGSTGLYVLAVAVSAITAANSVEHINAQLQFRHV